MAKKGEAARAFGASYSASMIGGVFGALVLAAAIPVMRPLVLYLKTPDFFAICAFGLSIVAMLAGSQPLKGLAAAMFGMLASFVGIDRIAGIDRWTFGQIYLWDGLPIALVFLGLFGLPELASLLLRGSIQGNTEKPTYAGMWQGIMDTLREWPLVLRCSAIGSLLGAVPGVGIAVLDWIAYGHASRRPGSGPKFGQGNVRRRHRPGKRQQRQGRRLAHPDHCFRRAGLRLDEHSARRLCRPWPRARARHARQERRHHHLDGAQHRRRQHHRRGHLPGADTAAGPYRAGIGRHPGAACGHLHHRRRLPDQYERLRFWTGHAGRRHRHGDEGAQLAARRIPSLGFVLGPSLENYFFLAYQISGWAWLTQPLVLILLGLAVAGVIRQTVSWIKARNRGGALPPAGPDIVASSAMTLLGLAALVTAAVNFPFEAAIFPVITAGLLTLFSLVTTVQTVLRWRRPAVFASAASLEPPGEWSPSGEPTMKGNLAIMGLCLALALLILLVGHLAATFAFVAGSIVVLGSRSWRSPLAIAAGTTLFVYAVFDLLASQPWPTPWLARLF